MDTVGTEDAGSSGTVEVTSALARAIPQCLQKSQGLRQSTPQLWHIPIEVSSDFEVARAPHCWQKFSPGMTRVPQRVHRVPSVSACAEACVSGRPQCLQ